MAFITTITRLPPAPAVPRGRSVDPASRAGLASITDALSPHPLPSDHLLLLSRKLARQSRDESQAMLGSSADGLDG